MNVAESRAERPPAPADPPRSGPSSAPLPGPILGVETTCDETSVGVLDDAGAILGLVVHSQDVHRVHGGVVPELAARDHARRIEPVVRAALDRAGVRRRDLAAIATAVAPGLIGALLVGATWSRAAALALDVPWVPVHHMEGHLFAPILEDPRARPPFVALLVSGGHTMLLWAPRWGRYRLLGETRDDAAGEAFDKVALLLGLSYPGGPAVQAAATGDADRYRFPRPMTRPRDASSFDFSFSGLKAAVGRVVAALGDERAVAAERPHLAASFQEAVVDTLARKTLAAARAMGCDRVLLGGGVAANRALRRRLRRGLGRRGRLFVASPRLSTDNGAMIARAGQYRLAAGDSGGLAPEASARAPLPGLARGRSGAARRPLR